MAYTPRNQFDGGQEEEGQEGGQIGAFAPTAPTISGPTIGTTPSVGGTASGNSAAAPQSQKQGATAGTGFTNIDKYLGANQGEGKRIAGIAGKQRGEDAAAFDAAGNAFGQQVGDAAGPVDLTAGTVDSLLDIKDMGNQQKKFTPINAGANQLAQNALSQTFSGPTSLTTTTGQNKSDELSRLLSNPETAAAKLATMSGPAALYNPQMSSLDQAILRSQSGDLSQISKDQEAENTRQGVRKSELEGQAAGKKSAIETAAANARGMLTGRAQQIQGAGPLSGLGAEGLHRIGALLGDQGLLGAQAAAPTLPGAGQPGGASVAGGTPYDQVRTAEAAQQRNQTKIADESTAADERERRRGAGN